MRKLQAITSPMFLAPIVVIYDPIHKYGHSMQDKLLHGEFHIIGNIMEFVNIMNAWMMTFKPCW